MRDATRLTLTAATIAVLALTIAPGCSNSEGDTKKPAAAKDGTDTGKCYGNGTCNVGLICSGSKICVKPPPADCAKVALQMSYISLGNYAEKTERASYVAAQTVRCKQLNISRDEGDCIARARHLAQLRKCRKGLIEAGRCQLIVKHKLALMKINKKAGFERFLVKDRAAMVRRCERKNPTRAYERCVLQAKTMAQARNCGVF